MAGYRKLGRTSNQRKAMIRSQVTALLYHGHIKTTETRAKEIRKVAEGLIALAVKEKDNFETVKVTAKVARKDANGKRVKEVVDGKKVTVYDEVEKKASLGASVTEVLSWVAEGSTSAITVLMPTCFLIASAVLALSPTSSVHSPLSVFHALAATSKWRNV